ncbi:MAG: hypothetical protein AAB426_13780 [Myxococcota bacterium]
MRVSRLVMTLLFSVHGAAAIAADTQPATLAASPLAKLNPDMSIILDVGAAWFAHANHFRQAGHAPNDSGIELLGAELAASANVDPYFRLDMYYQLRDAEMEEIYVTTLALPLNLQARAGLMNASFGRQNPTHVHRWRFADPPLSQTRFMSEEHFRGLGLESSVILPLPWYSTLLVQTLTSSEATAFNAATFGVVESTAAGHVRKIQDMTYVARAEEFFDLTPDWSLLLGGSGALGRSAFASERRAGLYGGDMYLRWRPISSAQGDFALGLTLEYIVRDAALEVGRVRDHGGYAELAAQLSRSWEVALRFDGTTTASGALPAALDMPVWQRRAGAALAYLPTHFSKIRLQGEASTDARRSALGYAVFLQAEVSAGEHGAHKF